MIDLYENQEKYCSRCGKPFICYGNEWAYRSGSGRGARLFCSWHCIQEWRKEKPMSKIARRERIIQAVMDGLSISEICKVLNEEPKQVWYWKKKLDKERNGDNA